MTDKIFEMEARDKLEKKAQIDYDADVMRQFKNSDAYKIIYRRVYAQTQENMAKILDKRRSNPHTLIQLASETAAYNEILRFIDEPGLAKKVIEADQKYAEEAHNAAELVGEQGDMYEEYEDGVSYYGAGASIQ